MKTKVFMTWGIICLSVILFSACVYTPYDGQSVTSNTPIPFQGFAGVENDDIHITAYNKSTGVWDTLATTTSASTPTNYGGQDLYFWSYSLDLSTISNFICYWDASCTWPSEGTYTAQFRVQEDSLIYLTSFENGGVACVMSDVSSGSSWTEAGLNCRSPNSPIINLLMHIIW